MRRAQITATGFFLLLLLSVPLLAVPATITIQGRLLSNTSGSRGVPITASTSVIFSFCNRSGAALAPDWTETQTIIPNAQGYFETVLGNSTYLDNAIFKNLEVYLKITLPGGENIIQRLQSVPFSYNADLLQELFPSIIGATERIAQTSTTGTTAFGSSGYTYSTAIQATGTNTGLHGLGEYYGLYITSEGTGLWAKSSNVNWPALFCQAKGSVQPTGTYPSYNYTYVKALHLSDGRIKILTGSPVFVVGGIRQDYITGKFTIIASQNLRKVFNKYVNANSQIFITNQLGGVRIWLDEVADGYFKVKRNTTMETTTVGYLVIN